MDPAKYDAMKQKLAAGGVSDGVAQAWGFNAANTTELEAARALLKDVGNDQSLVWHLRGKSSACSHAGPSKPLQWKDVIKGISWAVPVYNNLDDLYNSSQRKGDPECTNSTMKTIAATAAHIRVWKNLADGSLPADQTQLAAGSEEDGWYLILEDDVEFCPGWLSRLREELLQAPADADVLKLSWVGRWKNESSAGPFLEAPADPYEGLTADWMRDLMAKVFKPHHGIRKEVMRGDTLKTFSLSTFFGGCQAYMIRRSSLPRMMQRLNGTRFDYADLTLMMIGKTYAWRRVLAVEDGLRSQQLEEEAKIATKHLKKAELEAAKESKVEAKRKQEEESRKQRRKGKEDSKLALFREGHASGVGVSSVHINVPMCNKEPEDPVAAKKKYKHKVWH